MNRVDFKHFIVTGNYDSVKWRLAQHTWLGINEFHRKRSFLAWAKDVKMCKILLSHPQIDPNLGSANFSSLMIACFAQQYDIFELLLNQPGIDVNFKTKYNGPKYAAGRTLLGFLMDMVDETGKICEAKRQILDRKDIDVNADIRSATVFMTPVMMFGGWMHIDKVLQNNIQFIPLFCARGYNVPEKYKDRYNSVIWKKIQEGKQYLPEWNRFTGTALYYPKEFNDIAITWLMCCKQLPKDIRYLIIEYIARAWKFIKNL